MLDLPAAVEAIAALFAGDYTATIRELFDMEEDHPLIVAILTR